jgi:hypothetical protein
VVRQALVAQMPAHLALEAQPLHLCHRADLPVLERMEISQISRHPDLELRMSRPQVLVVLRLDLAHRVVPQALACLGHRLRWVHLALECPHPTVLLVLAARRMVGRTISPLASEVAPHKVECRLSRHIWDITLDSHNLRTCTVVVAAAVMVRWMSLGGRGRTESLVDGVLVLGDELVLYSSCLKHHYCLLISWTKNGSSPVM